MLSDEEKKAIDNMKSLLLYSKEHEYFSPFQEQEIDDMNIVLNIVEKQFKEIELLKEENEKYKNPPFFDEDNYISKEEAEQKERKAYIDGTNVADELCNKKWKDKIKAKIEEVQQRRENDGECELALHGFQREAKIEVLQSLLEKE